MTTDKPSMAEIAERHFSAELDREKARLVDELRTLARQLGGTADDFERLASDLGGTARAAQAVIGAAERMARFKGQADMLAIFAGGAR